MDIHPLDDLLAEQGESDRPYLEFLRQSSMSAGLYVLPAGAIDGQLPHDEDEVYVVLRGRGRFTALSETRDVRAGDTIFIPAGVEHRFHDITDQLVIVVVFAPPEHSSAG